MTRGACFALLVGILLMTPPLAAATRKFAVVVGNNQGSESKGRLMWAEKDAQKIRATLLDVGGFAREQALLILGADANEVWQAIEGIEQHIAKLKEETGDRVLFLFYYSGHAEHGVLELKDSRLEYKKLRAFLESSAADVRLAFLDSCESGKLIRQKGGSRGQHFKIQVTDEITSNGYAIITSSADNELSHESEELRGGFFTHHLISALRGAADESGDGKVTLNEAYQYTYRRTLSQTSTTVGVSQHPMYHFQLEGRGDIVIADSTERVAELAVVLPESGRLFLMDRAGVSILAETALVANRESRFALRSGDYRVYLVTPAGQVRSAETSVPKAGQAKAGVKDFETVELKQTVARGGLFLERPAQERWHHQLSGGALVRSFPLEGGMAAFGAALLYRLHREAKIEPAIKLSWATRDDVEMSTGYNELSAAFGVGYPWRFGSFTLRCGVYGSLEYLFQDKRDGKRRHTIGGGYLISLGAEYRLDRFLVGLDVGSGGRVFRLNEQEQEPHVTHRFDLQAILALGWRL